MSVQKYNKGEKLFKIETKDFPFKKLKDFKDGSVHDVHAIYVYETKYGTRASVAFDDCLVNLPMHMVDTARAMLNDEEVINDINAGKVAIKVRTFDDTKYNRGTCYTCDWIDK